MKKLNLGCSTDVRKGFVNLDINPKYNPDVVWDMTKFPYPFEDNTFDYVLMRDILEHFFKPIPILEEVYRICKPGAEIKIECPHWSHYGSWNDLDHKRAYAIRCFEAFEKVR